MGTLKCAWCGKELRADLPGSLLSHGMCVPCSGENGFVPIEDYLALTPSRRYDPFPSGWLILDRSGTVSSFRWSDEPPVGSAWRAIQNKKFFSDVAPWRVLRRLEQQFRRFVADRVLGEAEVAFLFRSGASEQLLFFDLSYDPILGEARLTVEQLA